MSIIDPALVTCPATPIRNLRITFWGVQGSSPIFPSPHSIAEYSRHLVLHTLDQVLADLKCRAQEGKCGIEALLGGPVSPERLIAYQQRVGLPDLSFYGGETTCIHVETGDGHTLLFDAGSGLRRAALAICNRLLSPEQRTVHLFGSHEHLDHRGGISFARICYDDPPFDIRVHGCERFLLAIDHHYGVFTHTHSECAYSDDPVDYTMMSARFTATEIRPPGRPAGEPRPWPVRDLSPIRIAGTAIIPFEVYHANTCCLGYRVEHGGASFVFATDHELRHGAPGARQEQSERAEQELRRQCQDADLLYVDGQYFLDEYLGNKEIGSSPAVKRIDWGHGCIEDVIERSHACRVKRTLVGHHDPERTWQERLEMDRHLRELSANTPEKIELADAEEMVDL